MSDNFDNALVSELAGPWQLVYLPNYVRVLREIERQVCVLLEGLSFSECMLPRIISTEQFEELQGCMPRFIPEWSAESLTARVVRNDIAYDKSYHLCHWQCEPFYFFLRKERPMGSVRLFDRSGWSYRAEKTLDANRLLAFQRIEVVFFVPELEAEETLDRILVAINSKLTELGLRTRSTIQEGEMLLTHEVLVRDLEALDDQGNWIEVVGSHLHGSLMLDGLGAQARGGYVTGCCGIGLSRITNILTSRG